MLLRVESVERDQRLHAGDEARIRAILAGQQPMGRQRSLELTWQGALEFLFDLALETAMRLREMYTLSINQLDVANKTIFLDKTQNGDKRQVRLSSPAVAAVKRYRRRGSRPFARIFDAAGCAELRFHDLRREATSRLFERTKLSDIEVSRITGHKDPRVLQRSSNLRGSELAGKVW